MDELFPTNLAFHASIIKAQHTKWVEDGSNEEERREKLEKLLEDTKKKINEEE